MPRESLPTRRAVLNTAGTICAGLAFAPWAQAADKVALSPAIDAHTHFYDPTRPQGVPWPGKGDRRLYRPVLPAEFKRLSAPFNVQGTVVVEASPWVEDNQWLLDLAAKDPFLVGVVGNLDPRDDRFAEYLKRFARHEQFRGIRVNFGDLRRGLEEGEYVTNLQRLADMGLALDVNGGVALPALVARLAEKVPGLRIVINHAANQPLDGKEVQPEWRQGMVAAASCRNVWCKVSALAEATGKRNGDAPKAGEFYQPVLDALWECFGVERLIYASNWPVSDVAATYATVHSIVQQYFGRRGPDACTKFFAGNARQAYRLP